MTIEEQKIIDKFLSKPITVKETVKFKSCGMTYEDGQALADKINYWVRLFFARLWNLGLLEEMTISPNYHAVLSEIDLGYSRPQPLSATKDELAEGVAMAVPILRDEKLVAHLVLNSSFMVPLLDENNEHFSLALSILAHECGHVHDLAQKQRALPIELLHHVRADGYGTRNFTLQQIAFACWDEYAACRLSATWAEVQTPHLEDVFCSAFQGIVERTKQYHRQYTEEQNILKLFNEVFLDYSNAAKYVSYLLGHVAGLEQQFEILVPRAAALIHITPFFVPLFKELGTTLETMWNSYDLWTSYEVFAPLERFAGKLLGAGGVLPEDTSEGLYIHVRTCL